MVLLFPGGPGSRAQSLSSGMNCPTDLSLLTDVGLQLFVFKVSSMSELGSIVSYCQV